MAYDGKLLAKARDELEIIKENNQREHSARQEKIYFRLPEIREIDTKMRRQMKKLVQISVSRPFDIKEQLDALQKENLALQARKAELLVEHGYSMDYLDDIYSCTLCKDTGTYNNNVCQCLKKLYNKELTKELSGLMQDGDESFEHFNLNYYSNTSKRNGDYSDREIMSIILHMSEMFAKDFPAVSSNLYFWGDTGLGKTYLSACIARAVASKGYSVCYDTAVAAFEAFERKKFSRDNEEFARADARVDRMLNCDLMILDDLGTEMVTPMSMSALYTLVNTRLVNKKHTIISSNIDPEKLEKKYSTQIASRINGEYQPFAFCGEDIRKQKKKMGL